MIPKRVQDWKFEDDFEKLSLSGKSGARKSAEKRRALRANRSIPVWTSNERARVRRNRKRELLAQELYNMQVEANLHVLSVDGEYLGE